MDAAEVLLWLLLAGVTGAALLLSFYGCAGVADETDEPTNASQSIGTSAAKAVFAPGAKIAPGASARDRVVLVPELVALNAGSHRPR